MKETIQIPLTRLLSVSPNIPCWLYLPETWDNELLRMKNGFLFPFYFLEGRFFKINPLRRFGNSHQRTLEKLKFT